MMSTRLKSKMARRNGTVTRTGAVKEDRHFVEALGRGLEILACFRQKDGLLGNQELAKRCGLAKSTVSRLTYTLLTRVRRHCGLSSSDQLTAACRAMSFGTVRAAANNTNEASTANSGI